MGNATLPLLGTCKFEMATESISLLNIDLKWKLELAFGKTQVPPKFQFFFTLYYLKVVCGEKKIPLSEIPISNIICATQQGKAVYRISEIP